MLVSNEKKQALRFGIDPIATWETQQDLSRNRQIAKRKLNSFTDSGRRAYPNFQVTHWKFT